MVLFINPCRLNKMRYTLTSTTSWFTRRRDSVLLLTASYAFHSRDFIFIVCLHKEIDDGFAFLLFARYKLWFPVFQDVSLAKKNPYRLLGSPTAKPPVSDHPKCEDLVVACENRTTRDSFLEKDRTHLHFWREFTACNH